MDAEATATPAQNLDLGSLPPLATERELGALLQIAPATLRRWRSTGDGPRYLRVGRLVRYQRSEIERWLVEGGE